MIKMGDRMENLLKTIDTVCTRKPHKIYQNQNQQIYLALYNYITEEDNSLFYSSSDRHAIAQVSPYTIQGEIIKNIITVFHMKREDFSNAITYINRLPASFNEEELEFSINNIFEKGGIEAVDIYIHSFKELPMKCIKHFIHSRYQAKKINKDSIKRYLDTHDNLQIEFRKIDAYYDHLKKASPKKVNS